MTEGTSGLLEESQKIAKEFAAMIKKSRAFQSAIGR
jgi:hypothetical protein